MKDFIKVIGAKENNLKNEVLIYHEINLLFLRVFLEVEKALWHLIQFLLKGKEDILNLFHLMPECFWDKVKNQM